MSISSVPVYESKTLSGAGKRGDLRDAYKRVSRGTENSLRHPNNLGSFFEVAAKLDEVTSGTRNDVMAASLLEKSAMLEVSEAMDAADTVADGEEIVLPPLDYDDVQDTIPDMPRYCQDDENGPPSVIPVTLDSDGHRVFDLDNPWYEERKDK